MKKLVLGAVGGLGGMALMAAPLSAATYTIDLTDGYVVLSSQNLAYWDPYYSEGTCSASDGFTPLYDGNFVGDTDAFDGGFLLEVDGTDYQDPDDTATRQGNTISLGGAADISGLRVNAVIRSASKSPTMQYLVKMSNPGAMNITTDVRLSTDLGSDGSTTLLKDSTNNLVHSNGDRWLVSGDAAGAPFSDPIVTQVFKGRNAPATSSVSDPMVNGNECVAVDFSVKVPAGATRYLLFFAEMHDNTAAGKKAAVADAKAFDAQKTMAGALNGIAPKLYSKIVNWNLKR